MRYLLRKLHQWWCPHESTMATGKFHWKSNYHQKMKCTCIACGKIQYRYGREIYDFSTRK